MGKLMFVRQNIVEAIPMTRREYVESRGWTLPENENPDEMVYKVIYADGYVSMCPKDKFDARSIECGEATVPFGYAIAECQYHGKRIARVGWNGEGQFVRFEEVLASEDGKLHAGRSGHGCVRLLRVPLRQPQDGRNRHSGRLARFAGRHEGEGLDRA